MQNDLSLPPDQRKNYKNAIDGLIRMIREEGPSSLFRGVLMNSTRGLAMTGAQLSCYDGSKRLLLSSGFFEDNVYTHITASFMSGFAATSM